MSWFNFTDEEKTALEGVVTALAHPLLPSILSKINDAQTQVKSVQSEIETYMPIVNAVASLVPAAAPVVNAVNEADTALNAVESESPNVQAGL